MNSYQVSYHATRRHYILARTRMYVCVFFKLIFQEYLVSFKIPKYLLKVLCNVIMGNFLRQGLSTQLRLALNYLLPYLGLPHVELQE